MGNRILVFVLAAGAAATAAGGARAQDGTPPAGLVEKVALCGVQRPLPLGAINVKKLSDGTSQTRAFTKQFDPAKEEWSGFLVVDGRTYRRLPPDDAWTCRADIGDFSPDEVVLMVSGSEETRLIRIGLDGAVRQGALVRGFFGEGRPVVRYLHQAEAEAIARAQLAAWEAYFGSEPNPVSE